jgi:hypothetical protein
MMGDWLSRVDKDSREARDRKIFEMWMACYTQFEIAEACDCSEGTVSETASETASLPKLTQSSSASSSHSSDFDPPIYNIWKQQTQSPKRVLGPT